MIDPASRHIYATFDEALNALKNDLLMMATLTERSLTNAMNGLFKRDDELSATVIADDEELDTLEKQVDQEGVAIMLRFQPVASDLRQIVSAMKVASNLERVADMAVNIARRARKMTQQPAMPEVHLLEPMFSEAITNLRDSIRAYRESEVELARTLKSRDKKLDDLDKQLNEQLTDRMAADPGMIKGYLNLIFVARHLERVGDHAKNIAENAIYAILAEDIRHIASPLQH